MKITPTTIFIFATLWVMGCEEEKQNDYANAGNLFILCEGNFGSANASLWSLDLTDETSEAQPNLYESITGNSLGDVANSMTIHSDRLYIVNTNSHTLEILGLGDEISFIASLIIPGSSPRFMAFDGAVGYLTTWNSGILILDLNSNSITDTISINGMADDIIYHNGSLYVSVPMNSDWSTNDDILKINISTQTITDTFNVISGPGRLLLNEPTLYIASTYYDLYWNEFTGTSSIDLTNGNVITMDYGLSKNVGSDLVLIDGTVYGTTDGGIVELNNDLSLNENNQIGNFTGVYSVTATADKLFFGLTDFVAPDHVVVTDLNGTVLRSIEVGPLPTDFGVFE